MSKLDVSYPLDFFDKRTVDETYEFIATLSVPEILKFRVAYQRELNNSNENNELPITTADKRRCFLYLTAKFQKTI